MDETDRKIIRALQQNGRLSNQDLSEKVNLSPSLSTDTPLDLKVKSQMLAQLFTLVSIQVRVSVTVRVS